MTNRNEPLLTIISPVTLMAGRLNRLSTWLRDIESSDVEVILIHDYRDQATADELIEIIARYKSGRLKLIEGNYGSAGMARNAGLNIATGRWIAFWDSDDLPEALVVVNTIEEGDFDGLDCLIGKFSMTHEVTKAMTIEPDINDISKRIGINRGIWRFIFLRESIHTLQFSNLRFAEDQMFLLEFLDANKKIKCIDRTFYHYYVGGEGHVTSDTSSLSDLLRALNITHSLAIAKNNLNKEIAIYMCTRQAVTLLRKGNSKLKLKASLSIFSLFMRSEYAQKKYIIRSFYFIQRLGVRT